MLNDADFVRINEALDSVLSFQRPFQWEDLQLRLSRFRFYDREFWPSLQEHGHPFFEWIVLLYGNIAYSVDREKIGEIAPGGSLLFAPGIQHIRPRLDGDTRIAILQFSLLPISERGDRLLRGLLNALSQKNYRISHSCSRELEEIGRYGLTQTPLWRMQIRNRTEQLFLSLLAQEFEACFSEAEGTCAADSAKSWIERIEKLVENTLDTRLPAMEYARQLGLSCRQLNRIVQKKYHLTFFRYLQQRRINAAKGLLRTPFQSVKMVANTVGFSDVSLFCRQFRQETGVTPLEYARSQQSPAVPHL